MITGTDADVTLRSCGTTAAFNHAASTIDGAGAPDPRWGNASGIRRYVATWCYGGQ